MKKVLIALDYNPTAQKIAEKGYSLSKSMNAEVHLLHVITDPVYYSSPEYSPIVGFTNFSDLKQLELINIDGLKKASQHFLDEIKKHLGDSEIHTIIGDGNFADAILSTAKAIHADVIVMGTHSHKWLENILIGSVAEEVLKNSTIPLFIIPTKKKK